VLFSPCVTALSWASVGSVGVRSSRVLSSLFEGCGVEEERAWVAQCQGMTPATLHSTRTTSVMTAQRRAVRTALGHDSKAASGDRRGGDSLFDPGARGVSGHLMLRSGEQVRCRGPRGSLERGGDPLERLEPSSEAETRSRGWGPRTRRRSAQGAPCLEWDGSLLRGVPPRARRRSARGRLDGYLLGHGGYWAMADIGLYSCLGCGWFG
jgi:hypothetical protein